MKKVVIAAQERIDDFEHTAIEFFRAVLGMDYGEYIVTDESRGAHQHIRCPEFRGEVVEHQHAAAQAVSADLEAAASA